MSNSTFLSPLLFALCSFFCFNKIIGQGLICAEAVAFCPSDTEETVSFPASVDNGTAEPGNDYGCLGVQPNPAWYYLQIGEVGNINIELSNTANADIDFALYGPFSDLNSTLDSCGTLGSPIDCSFSGGVIETVQVPSSTIGEVYLLLITNFSNIPTNIIGEATGAGIVSCCKLTEEIGASCTNASEFSCYCWSRGIEFELTSLTDTLVDTSCEMQENYRWLSFDACYCAATIELSSENCTSTQIVNAQLFTGCDTLIPVTSCLDLTGNESDLLVDTAGNTVIDFLTNETYQLLVSSDSDTCIFTVEMTNIPVSAPVFSEDTITGTTLVCENDTVIYNYEPAISTEFQQISFSTFGAEIYQNSPESFTVIYGENSGTLCITAYNCGGFVSICSDIIVQSSEECNISASSSERLNNRLVVFPNPTREYLYFETESYLEQWEIINLAGQILQTGNAQRGVNSINIGNLATGIYFIKVMGDESEIRKFIVE